MYILRHSTVILLITVTYILNKYIQCIVLFLLQLACCANSTITKWLLIMEESCLCSSSLQSEGAGLWGKQLPKSRDSRKTEILPVCELCKYSWGFGRYKYQRCSHCHNPSYLNRKEKWLNGLIMRHITSAMPN